jgi:peptidoglycan/LPS O-acetylase OafA/YrhL
VALCLIYTLIKTGSLGDYSTDYLLFAQNIKNPHPDFLGVAWSLAVEEWFYILFPSAVLVIYRIFPRLQIKYIVLIAIGLFFAMPLLYRIVREARLVSASVPTDYWDALFRKTVASRLDTIAFGILGAYVAYYHPRAWDSLKYLKFVLGLAIIGVAKFCMGGGIWFFTAYFDVLGLGILLLMPLLASIKTAPRCIAMPVTYISMASYSMYLIHSSLILDPILTYGEPFSKSSAAVCYVGYLTIAILASIAIYKYFEKPMMDLREKTYTL